MDRIGAIRNFHRRDSRRVFLTAPFSLWRRIGKAFLVFGLVCFLLGFAAGNVYASVSPCADISYSSGSFVFNGCSRDFAYEFCAFWTVQLPNSGVCTAVVNLNTSLMGVAWNGTFNGSVPFTKLGTYSCPAGTQLVGSMCELIPTVEFDPDTAGQFFGWGFTLVMLAGIAAWGAGQVLGFVDRVFRR